MAADADRAGAAEVAAEAVRRMAGAADADANTNGRTAPQFQRISACSIFCRPCRAKLALEDTRSGDPRLALDNLKRAFHFLEVEEAIETINSF